MKYIRIKNQGVIQPQAIRLLGASTKRNDQTKIGQFGSGNKYALAYFLRNNYEVKIMAGLEEIKLEVKPEVFRDQTFNVIYVNGEKTSITDQMGKDWKFWQAIREIYCNAIDEGDAKLEFVMDIEPKEGETHFYLDVKQDVSEFITNFDNYFATRASRVIFECEDGRILKKSTGSKINVYRRGVRCYEQDLLSMYDYDFNDILVGEDRIVSEWYKPAQKMWDLVMQCDRKDVIMNVLNHSSDNSFFEGSLWEYGHINISKMGPTFKECLETLNLAPSAYAGLLDPEEKHNFVIIPLRIYKAFEAYIPEKNKGNRFRTTAQGAMYKIIEPTSLQKATIKKAQEFLTECDLHIPYTINVARFDETGVMGAAIIEEEMILLSDVGLDRGVNEIVNTIIEEFIHIKFKVADKTRAFQTAVITEFISYMKKKNAFVL